jgi:ammonia channel protein AmtB
VFNMGDIAWTLASTALVWIMIPGVGFFYSGLLRRKNALNMIYLSMMTVATVSFQVRLAVGDFYDLLTEIAVVFLGLFSSFQ